MKQIHESKISPKEIVGKLGSVDVFDIIDDTINAGIRIVKKNSDVPTRPHIHPHRQIIYVVDGSGEITNTKERLPLNPGDFIVLDSNEEHYVITHDKELKVFEIKFP